MDLFHDFFSVPRGIDLSSLVMTEKSDHVLFGAAPGSDVKAIDGRIDGFRVQLIPAINATAFVIGEERAFTNASIAARFSPAAVFTVHVESFISSCDNVTSTEIASFQYCSCKSKLLFSTPPPPPPYFKFVKLP